MNIRELTYDQKKALTPEQRGEWAFKTIEEATAALKAVRSLADFNEFQFRLEACTGYFHYTDLAMKRSGYSTQSFSEYNGTQRCHYLICDGKSHGICRWENLYRVIEVRITWLNASGISQPTRPEGR